MIAKLTGILDTRTKDHAIVDVNGVGYLVRCSARTLDVMPALGGTVSLSVDTLVREDAIDLYGFATLSERDWFRLLMTVQGVGAKVALSLLSALTPDELARAIANDDKKISRARTASVRNWPGGLPTSSRTRSARCRPCLARPQLRGLAR